MGVHTEDCHSDQCVLVYGGTFDPPHLAHAVLPVQAADQLHCIELLYVPAAINPLKSTGPAASNDHRMAMLLLALADVSNARVSTIELDRPGPSYMIDTLRALHDEYARLAPPRAAIASQSQPTASILAIATERESQQTHFRLLIGSDQALDFHRWKDWQQILTLATPAVMLRPPYDQDLFRSALREKYSKVETDSWMGWVLRLPRMDISATKIRAKLRAGDYDSLREWLDPAVLGYIRANGLYAE